MIDRERLQKMLNIAPFHRKRPANHELRGCR